MSSLTGLAAAAVLATAGLPAPDGPLLAIHAAHLVDPAAGRVLEDVLVVISGDRIAAIGTAATTPVPTGARRIELGSATILPGLIDVHVHLTANASDEGLNGLVKPTVREAIDGVANARRTLEAGFTTVRNVGAGGFSDVALRDAINEGEIEGPRMLVSGPPLGATGGHADDNLLPSSITMPPKARRTAPGRCGPGCGRTSSTVPT